MESKSTMSERLASLLMSRMSLSNRVCWAIPPPIFDARRITLFARSKVLREIVSQLIASIHTAPT